MDYRKELLYKSTSAEKAVCKALDELNVRYIKQYVVKTPRKKYYIDIYIPSLRLAIEVDGKYHFTDTQKRLDSNRSACLRKQGISVSRITNAKAHKKKEVEMLIKRHLKRKHLQLIEK